MVSFAFSKTLANINIILKSSMLQLTIGIAFFRCQWNAAGLQMQQLEL
jgi:hypothetical protein